MDESKNYRQPWFKFYSQDWLTDLKIRRLSTEDKLSYIVLLCLANSSKERGKIFGVTEDDIIHYAGFYNDPYETENEVTRARGCLGRFHSNGSVVTTRNEDGTFDVEIKNFLKRQNSSLTNAERQAKFRDKARNKDEIECYESNEDDVTKITYREEKSREDKRRVYINDSQKFFDIAQDQSSTEFLAFLDRFCETTQIARPIAEREIKKFISYWTEPNATGNKQRWQMQKTFEVKRRLSTWFQNVGQWSKKDDKKINAIF